MILFGDLRIDLVFSLALILILMGVVYSISLLILSRFKPRNRITIKQTDTDFHVVFLIPCLNEATVVGASVERLLSLKGADLDVLVIDDGSDDGTADVVKQFADQRVHLLQRAQPNARLGKGEALNNAYQYLLAGGIRKDVDPDKTIICVVDADGRLESQTLQVVIPQFDQPNLGALQIGVRINNREQSMLARMQDIEFVLYTDVFQEGRRHLGSVGLGGNGQFVRLSALASLGERPWSRSLAEDLDLGVRLHLNAWDIEFSRDTAVHQQGLVDWKRWIKQRTRWFQGHLQAWPLVPFVLRQLRGWRRFDLLYHITSPYILLVGSFLTLAFGFWFIGLIIKLLIGDFDPSWWWLSAYLVAFGPALAFGTVYKKRENRNDYSRSKNIALLHLYVLYATLWYVSGWIAAYRIIRGQQGWAKTERLTEPAVSPT